MLQAKVRLIAGFIVVLFVWCHPFFPSLRVPLLLQVLVCALVDSCLLWAALSSRTSIQTV